MFRTHNLDPVIVIGTLLSVVLAVIFFLNTSLEPAFATFAALLGGIMTLQVEAYMRDRRRSERENQIERLEWLADYVDAIALSACQIEDKYSGTIAETECLRIFDDTKLRLKRLESGHFAGHWDDHTPATELIESARDNVWATSVTRADLSWWLSAKSRPYWQAQLHAIERGVAITRVFIYERWTAELDQLARGQSDAGVNVRLVIEAELDNEHLKHIIGMWDEQCGLRVSYSLDKQPWEFDFIVEEAELRELSRQFRTIHDMAVDLTEAPTPQ